MNELDKDIHIVMIAVAQLAATQRRSEMQELPVWLALVILAMAFFSWSALGWFVRAVGRSPSDTSAWVGSWLMTGAGGFALPVAISILERLLVLTGKSDAVAFPAMIFAATTAVALGWWLQLAANKK